MRVPGHQRKSYTWRWTAALTGLAVLAIALVMALVVAPAVHVHAATLRVNSDDDTDDGACTTSDCTLREAIKYVSDGDTITFNITGGGTIHLGSALDTLDEDNVTVRGQTTVTIKTDGDFNGLTVDADNVTLRDLHFDGNGSTGNGLDFASGSSDNTLYNVDVEDFDGSGIHFAGQNDSNAITGSDIQDIGDAAADAGIYFAGNDSHDNTITATINGGAGAGVYIAGASSDDNTITGSTISENGFTGVYIGAGSGNSVLGSTLEENTVDGVSGWGGEDLLIDSNTILNNGLDGVYLNGGDDSTVSNNTIEDNDDYGIELVGEDGDVIQDNVIGDNDDGQIRILGAATGDIGIYSNDIDTGSDGIVVANTVPATADIGIGTDDDSCNQFEGDLDQSGAPDPTDDWYLENNGAVNVDVDATYNAWGDADSSSEVEDTICAANASNGCGLGDVDFDDWMDSCAGAATSTPTRTPTPAQSYTPTVTNTPVASSTPTRTSTPVPGAATATPTTGPTESVTLVGGTCNPVASTYPDDTPIATIAGGVSPSGILISIWWFDTAGGRWLGYSPQFPQANDLTNVDRLEAIFICVSSAGTWNRIKI